MTDMMRKLVLPVLMLFAVPAAAEMMVSDARIMLGIGERPGVMHGIIMNHGAADTALIGADSPAFQRIELHTHEKSPDGMMRMRQVEAFALPQHGSVKLAPRGDHLMLFGFRGKTGDVVSVTLHFADAPSTQLEVATKARKKRDNHKGGHHKGGHKDMGHKGH